MTPLQLGAVHDVGDSETGVAIGVFSSTRYLGSIIGSSLLAGPLDPAHAGFPLLFAVLAAVSALGVAVAALLPGAERPRGDGIVNPPRTAGRSSGRVG
jgi:hypothetical protein